MGKNRSRKFSPSLNNSFFFLILVSVIFFGVFVTHKSGQIFKSQEVGESCAASNLSGDFDPGEKLAYFEGKQIPVPLVLARLKARVLGSSPGEKWIEVDLSDQKLKAWEGDNLFLETAVSTGLPGYATPKGEFHIWTKFRFTKMEGGEGKDHYYLPNVPFVMFFEGNGIPGWKGFGLHGTYWHSDFGHRRSHGCVNLPTGIAEQLYYWTTPILPEGKNSVRETNDDPGTKIVIHD